MGRWVAEGTARSARRLTLVALLGVLGLGVWGAYAVLAATAPSTPTITPTPSISPTYSPTESLVFTSSKDATSFQCSLNNGGFTPCTSSKVYGSTAVPQAEGSYTFQVKALDKNNNASGTASYSWVVDRTRPSVQSLARVGAQLTNAPSVSWTVTFSEAVKGVAAGNFTVVPGGGTSGTPAVTSVSGSGTTWTVIASTGTSTSASGAAVSLQLNVSSVGSITDLAGNALVTTFNGGMSSQFLIDKSVPTPAFTAKPPDPNGTATSTFAWSDSEPGVTYLCSVENGTFQSTVPSDGQPAQPCSSPLTYSVPTTNNGQHQFAAEAVDAAGNVSQLVSYSWKAQKASQPLTVSGNAPAAVYPGGSAVSFATSFSNPNTNAVTVTSLTVSLATVPAGCRAGWFTIAQSNVSSTKPITVPASNGTTNGTVTLPDAAHAPGVTAPTVSMTDSGDQTACKGATITVSYGGTFIGSFTVGSPSPFSVAVGPVSGGGLVPTALNAANKVVDTVSVTVTNPSAGAQNLHQLTYGVTPGWKATLAGHPDCTVAQFSINGHSAGAPDTVVYDDDLAPGAHVTHAFTIQLVENGEDQDACQGARVGLTVAAS